MIKLDMLIFFLIDKFSDVLFLITIEKIIDKIGGCF